jgi:hypothetical protein
MPRTVLIISDRPDCRVSITHHTDDPSAWILRQQRRGLLCRRTVLTHWHNTRELAEREAARLVKDCGRS